MFRDLVTVSATTYRFVGCYVLLRDCFIMLLPCHLGAYLAVAPAAAAAGCLRSHGVQGPTVRQTTFICADDTLLGLSQWIGSLFCPALEASRWPLETSSALYCYIVLYCVV